MNFHSDTGLVSRFPLYLLCWKADQYPKVLELRSQSECNLKADE